jgi:hypothetical protein
MSSTYNSQPIRIPADFSTETLRVRRVWNEVFQVLKENILKPRLLYPGKPSFTVKKINKNLP